MSNPADDQLPPVHFKVLQGCFRVTTPLTLLGAVVVQNVRTVGRLDQARAEGHDALPGLLITAALQNCSSVL